MPRRAATGGGPGHARKPSRSIDPQGKHALFNTAVTAAPDQLAPGNQKEGRDALFSTGPRRVGTVVVECGECLARSRISMVDLGVRLVRISVWLPGRARPHWMGCPACGRRTWCTIEWNG